MGENKSNKSNKSNESNESKRKTSDYTACGTYTEKLVSASKEKK